MSWTSARPQANGVKTLRQKQCDNPSHTTRGRQTTLRGWVVIVGFFTTVVLVIYRHLAAPKATQPYYVQKALGTWGKNMQPPPAVHLEAARRLRNHARLDKKIPLGSRLG